MADHTEYLELAREMISEEGRLITFAKLSKAIADADKPWKGTGAQTAIEPVTAFAVFVPVSSLTHLGMNIKDDELFKSAETVLIVAPPETGEDLSEYNIYVEGDDIESGDRFKIDVTQVLKPGPLALLYAMGASR